MRLDGLEGDPVYSRCPIVAFGHLIRSAQGLHLADVDVYSITTNQAAIAALFRVMNRYVGNLPPMPGVFPDYPASVVPNAGGEREMVLMR